MQNRGIPFVRALQDYLGWRIRSTYLCEPHDNFIQIETGLPKKEVIENLRRAVDQHESLSPDSMQVSVLSLKTTNDPVRGVLDGGKVALEHRSVPRPCSNVRKSVLSAIDAVVLEDDKGC